MSEARPEYLTVSQAAAQLGISERQARRYAGRLAPDDRREAGHMTGALISLAAMQIEREKATGRAAADVRPDALPVEAGHMTGHDDRTPDAQNGEVVALLKSENAFLRGLVEQRDRDAAELRAALREALKAMPKAITAGNGNEPISATQARESTPDDQTGAGAKQTARRGEKRQKLTAWQRVAARILRIR